MSDSTEPTVHDVDASGEVRPVDLRDYVDFSTDEARRVRVLAAAGVALDLWCIEPQQSTGVLQFPDSDVTYTVVGGRSWFVTEQGEIGLDPMGAVLVPAGTVHGIDNRGADPLIVQAAVGPPGPLHVDPPVDDRGLAIRDDSPRRSRGGLRSAFGRLLGED